MTGIRRGHDERPAGPPPAAGAPSPPAHAESRWRRIRAALPAFALGLALTAALVLVKAVVEHGRFGRQLEQMSLNLHQLTLAASLTDADLPVTVVDISDVPRVPRTTAAGAELVTDRAVLSSIVDATAASGARTIGVDVLMDPPPGEPLTADETALLDRCLAAGAAGIPTFVAIADGVVLGPDRWLGTPRFGDLAAYSLIPRPSEDLSTSMMVREITLEPGEGAFTIPSLAEALARAIRGRPASPAHRVGRWLGEHMPWLVHAEHEPEATPFESREAPINFGALPRLRATTVRARAAADVRDAGTWLSGKAVLIGRGETGKTTDVFTVPGQTEPVAGVYLHAAAVYSLVESPLFRPTHVGRVLADVLTALVPLGIVLWVTTGARAHGAHRLGRAVSVAMAVLVFVAGYFWVVRTGILWTDYMMVSAALLVHGPAERLLGGVWQRLRSRFALRGGGPA